jgi:DNA-binding response OmpR family regulator
MSGMAQRAGRVLIVDDDEGVRRTFAAILKRKGHEAYTASSADEGLREVSVLQPDAILLDLRMPLVNGFGFLYRLRSDPACRDLPVAIVTGDGSLKEAALTELRELGAEVWHKPLRFDELVTLADRLLARNHVMPPGEVSTAGVQLKSASR